MDREKRNKELMMMPGMAVSDQEERKSVERDGEK